MANTFVESLLGAAVAVQHVTVNDILIQDTPTEAVLEEGERQGLAVSDGNFHFLLLAVVVAAGNRLESNVGPVDARLDGVQSEADWVHDLVDRVQPHGRSSVHGRTDNSARVRFGMLRPEEDALEAVQSNVRDHRLGGDDVEIGIQRLGNDFDDRSILAEGSVHDCADVNVSGGFVQGQTTG